MSHSSHKLPTKQVSPSEYAVYKEVRTVLGPLYESICKVIDPESPPEALNAMDCLEHVMNNLDTVLALYKDDLAIYAQGG